MDDDITLFWRYIIMGKKILVTLIVVCCVWSACSADQGDWVDPAFMPIYTHPFYAGYLDILGTDNSYYYVYFPSENEPSKDPLVVRLSEGPGCSSLFNAFTEEGPMTIVRGTQNFRINPNNLNKEANLLYIEGPAEVGFSKGNGINMTDFEASIQTYKAILKFYEKFPELKDQDMYLLGRQYAGITIPYLALMIIEAAQNPQVPAWEQIKLAGIFLSNPCTMGDECEDHLYDFGYSKHTVEFLRKRSFITEELYDEFRARCTLQTPMCVETKKKIIEKFKETGADLTNIYQECLQQEGDYPCVDTKGVTAFLNNPTYRKDLHADPSIDKWALCNQEVFESYIRDEAGSVKVYEKLLKDESFRHLIRIWIVSGVQSGQIPTLGTKKWIEDTKLHMRFANTRLWEKWIFNGTINAGQVEEFHRVTFATLRSAGYDSSYSSLRIFLDQPEITHHMITSFLKGMPL